MFLGITMNKINRYKSGICYLNLIILLMLFIAFLMRVHSVSDIFLSIGLSVLINLIGLICLPLLVRKPYQNYVKGVQQMPKNNGVLIAALTSLFFSCAFIVQMLISIEAAMQSLYFLPQIWGASILLGLLCHHLSYYSNQYQWLFSLLSWLKAYKA